MDTWNPNQMPPMYNDGNKKSIGPLIAVIIILVLIIVGGLYFLKERVSEQKVYPSASSDTITDTLNKQSSSDDLNSIEKDLKSTDVNNLDQGASSVEALLQ